MKTALLAIALFCASFFYVEKTDLEPREIPCEAPNADFATDALLAGSYKANVVQTVFNRLKNAKGDFRSHRPYLRFVKETGYGVAAAFPKTGLILLEEKGYDLCASFGADSLNALAVLLSHELVHCYEKHDWEEYFALENNGLAVLNDKKEDEIQADYLGGFLAYQAGFATLGIMPRVLDKVYDGYKLTDDKLPNYPKKEERKSIAKQAETKLAGLVEMFEMANFLVMVGEYDDALEYYERVLEDFQSREVFNNIGVVATLTALRDFTEKGKKFSYPVELDMHSNAGTKSMESKAKREELLLEALDFFEKARQYDAFYPIAHVNEGCAHALLGLTQVEFSGLEWDDAEIAGQRALRLSKDDPKWATTHADALVLLGIVAALRNEVPTANRFFGEALQLDAQHFLAKANQNTLNGLQNEPKPVKLTDLSGELIDGIAFESIRLDPSQQRAAVLDENARKLKYAVRDFDRSRVLSNLSTSGTGGQKIKKTTTFHFTNANYEKASAKGIRLGDKLSSVLEKYGEPQARMSLGDGLALRYQQANGLGMVFQFDSGYRLRRWGLFWQN